jgi:hypothetical protein
LKWRWSRWLSKSMLSSPQLTSEAVDMDELRARLRKMTDADLIAFGKAARYMCSPAANLRQPPREPFVIQLREARAEWRRRMGATEPGLKK